jgi:hypothetical protein
MQGYCFGDINQSGTALIILESGKMLWHTPDEAYDLGWSGLYGHDSAFIAVKGEQVELEIINADVFVGQ